MNRKTSFLSIKEWGIVFVLAGIIQIGLHIWFVYLKNQECPFTPILSHIKQESSKSNTNTVLVFGSSLMGYGLTCPDDSIFKSSEFSIYKLWDSGDPFETFFSEKYIDQIIDINPKLICIQTELAAVNLEWLNNNNNFIKKISKENKDLKQLLFQSKAFALDLDKHCKPQLPSYMLNKDTLNVNALKRHIKSVDEISPTFEFLNKLKDNGIKIVIIDIPRPHKLEQKFKNSTYQKNLKELLNYYQSNLDIDYWAYDGKPLFFKSFLDRGHLNEQGKIYYSQWLKAKIQTNVFQ